MIGRTDSSAVPVLLSPLVVVDAPRLDHRTAAIQSLLLGLVGPVASEALIPHLGFLLFGH